MRVAVTVLSALGFVGIWVWAWKRSNAAAFAEAAQLPFRSDVDDGPESDTGRSVEEAAGGRQP